MTMDREAWLKRQDRKRIAASTGIVAAAAAAALAALLLIRIFAPLNLNNVSGPIMVRLGSPEGANEAIALNPPAAAQLPPEQQPEEAPPEEAPPPPEEPTPEEKPGAVVVQKASPKPAASKRPAASRKPAASPSASARARTSPQPSAALALASPVPGLKATGSPGPLSIKGSEAGNAHETVFGSGGTGEVSRSLYAPIYLYMPLPRGVEPIIQMSIRASSSGLYGKDEQLAEFARWYEYSALTMNYRLKDQPPLDDRPRLWLILEDARYPMEKADYKYGRDLSPVVLDFTVGAPRDLVARLKGVKLEKSSGDPSIDQAVLYGFEKAAFSNKTTRDISGTFTYNF